MLGLLALAVPGCGSDSRTDSKEEPNGLRSKPPQQVLAAAAKALGEAKSFHVESAEASSGKLKADVAFPDARIELNDKDASYTVLIADGSAYLRANSAYWRKDKDLKSHADSIAGRWFKVPLASRDDIVKTLRPKVLSRCLLRDHGSLSRGGTATVDGKPAVVIVDKGDRPGTTPSKLYVAATGKPFPLRQV